MILFPMWQFYDIHHGNQSKGDEIWDLIFLLGKSIGFASDQNCEPPHVLWV